MSDQSEPSPEATNSDVPLSIEEALIAKRTQAHSPQEEPEQEEQQEESENETEEEQPEEEFEEETESETEQEPEAEQEQEIDLESLTPEQIQQLAKKGKSRLLQRIGELTAKNKALEEQANRADAKPLPKAIPASENPFRDLKTIAEVQAKIDELEKVAEDTDRILDDHEDYGSDDVIKVGSKEYTKKEIKTANRNARNALVKFLPAQQAEIAKADHRKAQEEIYNAAIPTDIPETADETSETAIMFKGFIADPLVEQIRQHVPEIAPQLSWLLAHAARSINSKPKPKIATPAPGEKPKPKVAGNPVPAGAARSGGLPAGKKLEQARKTFEETGSEEALVAARIARNL